MKLKARPDDFRVEERVSLRPRKRGRYAVYRLEKRFWNTLDVIRELERRYRFRDIGRAGLKDRYALSVQFISTTTDGPATIREKNWQLSLVGRSDEPVSREMLLGNRFTITLRALTGPEADAVAAAWPGVCRSGVPSYYDEQRLGSARHGAGFIARKLIAGHYNGALKLWLATPSGADDPAARRRKQAVLASWGDWRRCLPHVPPEARAAVEHLAGAPGDFKGAVQLIDRRLLELFLNAWQGWVWNETLALVLERTGVAHLRVKYGLGTFVFYDRLQTDQFRYLSKLTIPAPGPRARFASDRVGRAMNEVLAADGLELTDIKLRFRLRGLFFHTWDRPAVVIPRNPVLGRPKPDELYPGRLRLTVGFFLPGGAYATILVKRLLPC
ncbi:MAG: tRNA pseudouridine(13) synthase TruD [bacterium]